MGSKTLGERRVGPMPENMTAAETKKNYAAEIDRLEGLRKTITGETASQDRQRTLSTAQTHAEIACMFAVKALYQ